MYSLTFCVRVMLQERHQWKPAVQAAAVTLRTSPSTASQRPAARADLAERSHYVIISRDGRGMDANPPNSAQLGGSLYHAPKLHPGRCGSVGVRPRTDTQTDTRTRVTTIHLARLRLTQNVIMGTVLR